MSWEKKKKSPSFDGLVKSHVYPFFVIPPKAGIQLNQEVLGSRLRGSDGFSDFLRDHQFWKAPKLFQDPRNISGDKLPPPFGLS